MQFEIGQIEAAAGRLVAASVAFRNVIAIVPNHAEAWRQLGATLDAQGDAAGAIDALLRAVSLARRAADVARRLSVLLAESGRVAEAIACLDRAADAQPRTLDGRLARARAFLLGRRYDEAEQAVLRALATAPATPAR